MDRNRPIQAMLALAAGCRLYPRQNDIWEHTQGLIVRHAQRQIARGLLTDAEQLLEQSMILLGQNPTGLSYTHAFQLTLSQVSFARKDYAQAAKRIEPVYRSNPTNDIAKRNLGVAYYNIAVQARNKRDCAAVQRYVRLGASLRLPDLQFEQLLRGCQDQGRERNRRRWE